MTPVARAEELAALEEAFASAARGNGRLVLLSGEAGAGKSTLIAALRARIAPAVVLVGHCDPLSAPRPAGPLSDVAASLDEELVRILAVGERRGLFDAALRALTTGRPPRVIVFEDIHWADELTLELLGFFARRIAALPLLVIASYREDQVTGSHPTRRWLGTVSTVSAVTAVRVPPLSVPQVAELAAGSGLDPLDLHTRTGGNAFFVSEILAAPHADVPSRVADAIAARTSRLTAPAHHALAAAAVLGSHATLDVLLAMPDTDQATVEECVRAGLLSFAGSRFEFRHELTRQAVLSDLNAFLVRDLHAAALAALQVTDPDAVALLADHAECAGDAAAVLRFAPLAADRATRLGSHREAAAQLRRALRFADAGADDLRAHLYAALSYELFLTGELTAAFRSREAARTLRTDDDLAGVDLRWMSRIAWYAGRRADAEQFAARATELHEARGPSAELALAYGNESQLLMLAGRYREAVDRGRHALAVADAVHDVEARVHALNNVGTSALRLGDRSGADMLEHSLELALAHELDDHAARAYVNLADSVNMHDGVDVERHLSPGRRFTQARQLALQSVYLDAAWARLLLNRGRWAEAERVALDLLDGPNNLPQRFEAGLPLLLVRIRRGEPHLDLLVEMTDLAERLREPQRVLPVLFARAEAAWLAGELASLREELGRHLASAQLREDVWRTAQLHFWLRNADANHVPPPVGTGPYATQLHSAPRTAAAAWRALDSPYEAAVALLDGSEADVRSALADFRSLGAEPAARLARIRLRELGVSTIPRGPRRSTACHPFGLTSRQHEVLELLAEDLTNHEIAAQLVLSERTVDHHVSALLAKLQVRNRRAAARVAREQRGTAPVVGSRAQGRKAIQRSSSASAAPESTERAAVSSPAATESSRSPANPS